ncbi:MAG: cysteine--tRNA ligase [Phycisphaerales bacterium]|nr:cysteine--tRNA ligase [Phycisphaerales bacterium]MCB9856236.1 cysteine--tRNA ligase [Phycisphaerales bacterium]MCB9863325.1 cysteine--tRNA ligase [Phycisphaerales bacterium]
MTLRLYNTLTSEKELFDSVKPGEVGIYLCGPTVYKPSHIGHAVGPVIFDVIKRYLTFKNFKVTWVLNVTDVEDKLIAEAEAQGRDMLELARDLERQYVDAMGAMGVKNIDYMPRASEHIQEIIDHINDLIEKGHAYVVEGDVYFDVSKDEDYGKLTNRKADDQESGTREGLVKAAKRNPGDFALWKAAKPGEPASAKYQAPWGVGRPGWHIECSAMAMKYLGKTFDIHGGGLDLKFPHHENEIAQAECATGQTFAKYWMHHGLTRFNTKKIAKSDPEMAKVMESLQIANLLKQHDPESLRFLILQSHYRSPIDFSDEVLKAAKSGLGTFRRLLERVERVTNSDPYKPEMQIERMRDAELDPRGRDLLDELMHLRVRFLEEMDDDFNTAGAIAVLFEIANAMNKYIDAAKLETHSDELPRNMLRAAGGTLVSLGNVLGLFERRPAARAIGDDGKLPQLVELLVNVRKMSREAKQYAIGDHIRDELTKLGITLEDGKDGTRWRID